MRRGKDGIWRENGDVGEVKETPVGKRANRTGSK